MENYIWLFPLLFIFHDMEEIIGLKMWLQKNKELFNGRLSMINEMSSSYSTEGMAVAVFEELILCITICIISLSVKCYGIWLGVFIAYTIHLLIHMGQSIIIRKYVPALATSIICLLPSIYIIKESIDILGYDIKQIVLFSLMGIAITAVNLKFAHTLMYKFNKWMER